MFKRAGRISDLHDQLKMLFDWHNSGRTLGGGDDDADLNDYLAEPHGDELLEDWLRELNAIKQYFPRDWANQWDGLEYRIEQLELDFDGFVDCECCTPQRVYNVSLDVGVLGNQFECRCDCQPAARKSICSHTYCLVKYLIDELSTPGSPLRAEIRGESEPGAAASPVDPLVPILDHLDSYLNSSPLNPPPQQNSPRESELVRLAWRLNFSSSGMELVPLQQRCKKRGVGWTKGQAISLHTLYERQQQFIHTAADARVLQALRVEPAPYYGSLPKLSFNLVQAVDALVQHEAVYLNDQPTEVRRFTFGIRIVERPEGLLLGLALPDLGRTTGGLQLMRYPNGIIAVAEDANLVLVCQCTPAQSKLAEGTWTLPPFPVERLDAVRERLEKIRETTIVELPPALAGPFVPLPTTSVVLLRSNQQGSLECGLRVQDDHGRLASPGEGMLVYADQEDGQPVQRRRDAQAEIKRGHSIARVLTLDRAHQLGNWDWRIVDFDQSLLLLEDLEKKSEECGFKVIWDPNSVQSVRVLGSINAQSLRVVVSRKKDWFGISGQCRLGDREFSLAELLEAIRSEPARGFIEIRSGEWAKITDELRTVLTKLHDVAHRNRNELEMGATAAPMMQELLEAQIDIEAPKAWRDCIARMDRSQQLNPDPPASFAGTFRDYQLDGYRWLRRLAEWGVGGCLADDMGLGKTVQALALLIDRMQSGPALVIAPTSVGFNWVREAARFAPELKAHLYRETDRSEFLDNVGAGDLVVCSYGLCLRDQDRLANVNWGTLILDEAQFIKNSRTKTSQAIRRFQAGWTLALTGTPMENHLGELWSIFRNVSPGLFGSWDSFRDNFAGPIERDNDQERRRALSRLIRPFVLRRTKREVLNELPDRTEMNLYVELSDQERRRYDEMRLAALGELDQIVGLPDTGDQRFRILAIMTRLRQLACHVGLVDKAWEGESAKLALLVETLRELKDEGHRALIFSQFTSYLAFIRQALDSAGLTYEYLDGATTAKARQERVDAFQAGKSDAFLISLKAGGTGLNLTAADYVIHMDPWWNPAVEDQATDRAHRIGQTRPVMVYRIVARGTIEEQILDLHSDKRNLVAGVLEGTQSAGRLPVDRLISLIRGEDL